MKKSKKVICLFFSAIMLTFFFSTSSVAATGFDVETVYNSVFVIYTDTSVGSGFAIGNNGIITNAHVVENAQQIEILTYDGLTYDAYVVLYDEKLDLALLSTSIDSLIPLPIGSVNNSKIGDDIYTIGAPNSLAYTLTKGVISAKERVIKHQTYIQIDAAINGGNSGGPLLNDFGEVIGVNTLKMSDMEGIGLSIPIERVITFLADGGISLNNSNNIDNSLEYKEHSGDEEHPNVETDYQEAYRKRTESNDLRRTNSILVISLAFSIVINIAFIGLFIYERKQKMKNTVIDPSERTDFEIEIEE